jgi:tubulin monoglycylase TTLL3/8
MLLNTLNHDKFLLLNLLLLYEQTKNCFDRNFGINNLWIIKPTGVSRGTGIKIEKDFVKIINSRYGKIVQKYIEKPLLLHCQRKFDIRQWVLVKSFFPL